MAATARAQSVGKLEKFPLTDLLVFLLDQRASGTLVLQEPNARKSALYFYMGAAVKAKTPALLIDGTSPVETLNQHLEWVATLSGRTIYGFYPNVDYLHRLQPTDANPLAQIWRCAKRSVDPTRVNAVIGSLAERRVVLHPRSDLSRFSFGWEETAALELTRSGEHTFNDLLFRYDGDPAAFCKLVYVLAICRHLDFDRDSQPVGVEGPDTIVAPRVPEASSIPMPAGAVTKRQSSRPYKSSVGPPRAMSGMKRQARAQGTSAAPHRRPSTHPPSPLHARARSKVAPARRRLSPPPPAMTRGVSVTASRGGQDIHTRVTRPVMKRVAPLTGLVDAPQRSVERAVATRRTTGGGSYHESGDPGARFDETQRPPPSVENEWTRAEALAKSGNFDKALGLVEGLYVPGSKTAHHGAFVAYLRARVGKLKENEASEHLAVCAKAVLAYPEDVKYRFYRGWVYKALGRVNASLMEFVEVARYEPANVDAARELFLARKRKESSTTSSGLMGRFKRSLTPNVVPHQEVIITRRPPGSWRK